MIFLPPGRRSTERLFTNAMAHGANPHDAGNEMARHFGLKPSEDGWGGNRAPVQVADLRVLRAKYWAEKVGGPTDGEDASA